MAEKIVSPGVFTKEIDASFLPAAIGNIGAVIVGPTVKGPALNPTVVSSYQEFQAKFGDAFRSGSDYYQYLTSHTARNYLQHQSPLTVVRIMGSGYNHASADIINAGIDNSTWASGSFAIVGTFGQVDGDEIQISVGGTEYRFIATEGDSVDSSPIFFTATGSDAATYLDALSGSINTANIGVIAGGGQSATNFNLSSSVAGADGNQITFNSGSSGGDFTQSFALQGGTNSTAGGTTAITLHTLGDGAILNSVSETVGENNVLSEGNSNNYRWEISTVNDKKGTFTLLIRQGDDTYKKKQILETWSGCSLDPNTNNYVSKVIGDQDAGIDGSADDPYLGFEGDYTNKSKYVRVEIASSGQTPDYLDENGNVRDAALTDLLPKLGSGSAAGSFSGGLDGNIAHPIAFNENISATNMQGLDLSGDDINEYTRALNLLSNADEYDFNLLLIPGICRGLDNHAGVVTKAIDICEARGDAFVIVDVVGADVTSIGSVTDQGKAMDSNYAAAYWPWIQVADPQTGKNVWVPPSVVIAGIYAFNDKVAAPWYAPAGLNRGVIGNALQAARKLQHGERDALYEASINPIATFPGEGVAVWGQKTLQKRSSALDRVNVRRLLIKVKKFLAASSRFLVFEQNNAKTRSSFLAIANPFLKEIEEKSGLNAFKVVMDASNNTPDIVDRNILYGQIFLQPTKTAEFIVLDFTIQPTGASFPE